MTRFETASGIAEVVDFMPSIGFGANLGIVDRLFSGMVIRIVRGVEGRVQMRQEIAPCFDYGRDRPIFELVPGRGALIKGRKEFLSINCEIPLEKGEHALTTDFTIEEHEEHHIIACYHGTPAALWLGVAPGTSDRLFGYELLGWRTWISRCEYEGPYSEHVRRSALALKLLDYMPTGGMAAAATTSLPEDLGGVRNWDYRYSWIRDTTYAIYSFMSIGYREEAESFFQWIVDATNLQASSLQVMYSVGGETDLQEQELSHLRRLSRVETGAHRKRRPNPKTARCLGGAARCRPHLSPLRWRDLGNALELPGVARQPGALPLARARFRHLGGAQRAAPDDLFQRHELGCAGPGDQARPGR